MPTPLHRRTQSHRRAKALPCKRNHRPSRHITSTTHLTGILRIGRHTPRGPATRPRRRLVRLRRLSVPARLRLESSRTSRRGKRVKMALRHRRGVIAACLLVLFRSPFTAIYHDYCTCGIFFFFPPSSLPMLFLVHPFFFPLPFPPPFCPLFFSFSDLPICIVIVRV